MHNLVEIESERCSVVLSLPRVREVHLEAVTVYKCVGDGSSIYDYITARSQQQQEQQQIETQKGEGEGEEEGEQQQQQQQQQQQRQQQQGVGKQKAVDSQAEELQQQVEQEGQKLQQQQRSYVPHPAYEWKGLYLQFDLAHVLGTVSYRWDQGYASANVVTAVIRDLDAVIVHAEWMWDGSVDSVAKAKAIRNALGLKDSPHTLLDALAVQGKVLVCAETETQWELVIGHDLIHPNMFTEERIQMQLKPDSSSCTAWSRLENDDKWKRYDDALAFQEIAPPKWITEVWI